MSDVITARPSKRLRVLWAVNRTVQLISLWFLGEWSLYGLFRCPFVVPFVSCQNCPVMTCPGRVANFFWGFWGIWLAVGILFGRAFCGWMCPGGSLTRVFSVISRRAKLLPQSLMTLNNGKYLMLLLAIWVYFVLNQPRVNLPIRVGEFWPSVSLTMQHAFPMWELRTGIVVLLFLLSLVVMGVWCRFACPMGGVLELVRKVALFGVHKSSKCNDCDKCRRACYLDTRPDEANCTNCGDCVPVCPQKCIVLGRKPL